MLLALATVKYNIRGGHLLSLGRTFLHAELLSPDQQIFMYFVKTVAMSTTALAHLRAGGWSV